MSADQNPSGGASGSADPAGFVLPGGGGSGSGSGSSSGGGGSSSGGSGGHAAPKDPTVSAGDSLYFQLWGTKPPSGYVEGLVKKGLNLYEIELHERSKPAFALTRTYRDERTQFEASVAKFFGLAV